MKNIIKILLSLLLILVIVGCSSPKIDHGEKIQHSFTLSSEGLTKNTYYVLERSAFSYDPMVAHEQIRLFSSLQGLINRNAEMSKIVLVLAPEKDSETFWIEYMKNKGGLLRKKKKKDIATWEEFLSTFKNQLIECGMILWDTNVPATANVAATICGIEGCLPVKDIDDGVKTELTKLGVEVKQTLTGKFTGKGKIVDTDIDSTGSTKCDAYLWAMEKYMDKCSDRYMMFVPDGASSVQGNPVYEGNFESKRIFGNDNLVCHDYGIARQMFFVDLSPIKDSLPVDDSTQPLGVDTATLEKILNKRYENAKGEFGCMVGMPPWQVKYTSYQNMGTVTTTKLESEFLDCITQYNMYLDGSNMISNSSVYYQFKLDSEYSNGSKKVTEKYEENTVYVYYHMTTLEKSQDAFDMLEFFNDEKRGEIPLSLAVNPGLADRIPMVFDYIYNNLSNKNTVVAANGGIGSISPNELFVPKDENGEDKVKKGRTLPSGKDNFVKVSEKYLKKFDLNMVGFLKGTMNDDVYGLFSEIAPKGVFHNDFHQSPTAVDEVNYYPSSFASGRSENLQGVADSMYTYWSGNDKDGNFLAVEMTGWTPTQIIQLTEQFENVVKANHPDYKVKVVNCYNFMSLATEAGIFAVK